ncbi:MAG: hypothetical protein ACFFDC_03165 [Promethearchaeota archaeon]
MTRQKIRKKKPNDNITSKIPVSSRNQKIKQKTPASFDGKSFDLPPPKTRGRIPKDELKIPSRYGISDQNKKESINSNISPPVNESLPYEAKSPTNKGLIPKNVQEKSQVNTKTPNSKQIDKIDTIPSSKGVIHSKKELFSTINRPPPPNVHQKTPRDTTTISPNKGVMKSQKKGVNQSPPIIQSKPKTSSIQHSSKGGKNKQKNVVNQPPPTKIQTKSPVKKKVIPPPIFNDIKTKIPKTKVKTKKPR